MNSLYKPEKGRFFRVKVVEDQSTTGLWQGRSGLPRVSFRQRPGSTDLFNNSSTFQKPLIKAFA